MNLVRGVMTEILTKGRVVRGWIGIVPADIDQIDARRFNLAQPGVVVAKLYVGSPAAAVGMEPRDIILTVNGVKVTSAQDTLTRIANVKPGQEDQDHGNSRNRALRHRSGSGRAAPEPLVRGCSQALRATTENAGQGPASVKLPEALTTGGKRRRWRRSCAS